VIRAEAKLYDRLGNMDVSLIARDAAAPQRSLQ